MEIVYTQRNTELKVLNTRDENQLQDSLLASERELLDQLTEAFTIIHGGYMKKRRLSA